MVSVTVAVPFVSFTLLIVSVPPDADIDAGDTVATLVSDDAIVRAPVPFETVTVALCVLVSSLTESADSVTEAEAFAIDHAVVFAVVVVSDHS